MTSGRLRAAAPLLWLLVCAGPAAADAIGNVGAANVTATGEAPGAIAHVLTLGANVVEQEKLQTDDQGAAQIVFNDRSALNLGRNSSLVIDRFVYDPARASGEMTARLTRGALRFVGGQISHTSGATIETSSASVGIRGGVVTIEAGDNGAMRVINGFGTITVSNAAGSQTIRRPGWEVTVAGANTPPGAPHAVDPRALASIEMRLTSAHGQTGGARTAPSDVGSARFGVGSTRADNTPHPASGAMPAAVVLQTSSASPLASGVAATGVANAASVVYAPRCTTTTTTGGRGPPVTTTVCN